MIGVNSSSQLTGGCLFPCLSIVLVVKSVWHLTLHGLHVWGGQKYGRTYGWSRDIQNFSLLLGYHFLLPMVLRYLLAFIERAKE